MLYYRHPCSAACFLAPSRCHLRRFGGPNRAQPGRIPDPGFSNAIPARTPPKKSRIWIRYSCAKKDLSGGEIWAPKVESDLSGGEMQRIPIQIRHLFALSKSDTKWGTPLVLVHHYLSNFRIFSKNPRKPHFLQDRPPGVPINLI